MDVTGQPLKVLDLAAAALEVLVEADQKHADSPQGFQPSEANLAEVAIEEELALVGRL